MLLDTTQAHQRIARQRRRPHTPGLPYGVHLHWRWGATAATGATKVPGGPQFAGPGGPGKPLIDPRIHNQNIEFAIVDGSGRSGDDRDVHRQLDRDPATYLFDDFSKVWEDLRPLPELLMPSGDLVIWVSQTAWGPGWNGTTPPYRERFPASGVSPERFPDVPHDVRYLLPEWGGTLFPQGIFFPHEDISVLPPPVRLIPGVKKSQFHPGAPARTWRRP